MRIEVRAWAALGLLALPLIAAQTPAPHAEAREPSSNGFLTRVESGNEEILKLENGAVVEVTSGYLGYLGYRKKALVYKMNGRCRLWIEDKKLFQCDLLREPIYGGKVTVEELSISTVAGDGEILKADDGRVFEVNSLFTLDTALWLAPFEAVLVDGSELVNLDEGDEPVEVGRLK